MNDTQQASDLRRRRGVLTISSELIDRPECVPDLLSLFGRIIPTRVECLFHRAEFEVYFISPDVRPISEGEACHQYNAVVTVKDGTRTVSLVEMPQESRSFADVFFGGIGDALAGKKEVKP